MYDLRLADFHLCRCQMELSHPNNFIYFGMILNIRGFSELKYVTLQFLLVSVIYLGEQNKESFFIK